MMKNSRVWLSVLTAVLIAAVSVQVKAQSKPESKTDDEVIKIETALITVPVIVSDRQNRYISGLKQQDFSISQNGKPQKVEFFINQDAPITVALLLDTSRSTEDVLDEIKDAAIEFIDKLRPNDKALIVSFDSDVEVLSAVTGNKNELKNAIANARIGERVGTVLNDAVSQIVNQNLNSVKGRKSVILLTDGKDAGSSVSTGELKDQLNESDAMIYSIFYETGNNNRGMFGGGGFGRRGVFGGMGGMRNRQNQRNQRRMMKNEEAKDFLRDLADETAGRFYQNDLSDLDTIFSSIADELRKQYVLGFYPDESIESDVDYQIKVAVKRPDAVVRAKNFYRKKSV